MSSSHALEDNVNKWVERLAGTVAILPCRSRTTNNQLQAQLTTIEVKKSDTRCSYTHPAEPLACNITIDDTRLTIDERFRFIVSSPRYLTIGLTLEYSDENPTKLIFKNVINTVPHVSIWISLRCPARLLKPLCGQTLVFFTMLC